MEQTNPCTACGACCANFRVSFYWAEAPERGLPEALYAPLNATMAHMIGTNCRHPRCAALSGEIGRETRCAVYDARPSPCRSVEPGDDKCRQARAAYGLAELSI
ncbi:YkgJ family cysteine cluster protein [Methylocystis sp. Sn-Cys]|uniref:YkgJ family cysteine cluster protein n=1 Tax=Methylocystis sp. Sn-Cys TaxID=1701263 RepID=UPI001921DCF0|nr:YkgJ family cysteine cluster protein [Methylocystis sp. Sn-Cys]MBL1257301.1 YkgJ family cysteine cluster protein [Methylocystis sp. Sn-Cys]